MENRRRYTLADLNPNEFEAIERLENQLGLTLIAYEPTAGATRADPGVDPAPPGRQESPWAGRSEQTDRP